MQGLPTTMPTAYGSPRDVKSGIISDSGSHHLSKVTHIIRYCNSPVEYDVNYGKGKYNKKCSTLVFTKVTSISIHHPSSYKIVKSCHMTFVQVAEHNPPIKDIRSTRTLFSCYRLHPRLQAIKLLASLSYPLKITKGHPLPHPDMSPNLHLVDIRHGIGLNSGCCGCKWHLEL
jgi:hypothetical protein